jgi:hypothetical protein
MPVRGTTHAIIQKKIINNDSGDGRKIICAWDTCTNDGYELYKTRVNTAAAGYGAHYVQYVFCCERHKQYWVNSTISYGNLH